MNLKTHILCLFVIFTLAELYIDFELQDINHTRYVTLCNTGRSTVSVPFYSIVVSHGFQTSLYHFVFL